MKNREYIYYPSKETFFFQITYANIDRAKLPLNQHIHKNMFELVYMLKGIQTYCIEDKAYTIETGDLFITKPNTPHGTKNLLEDKSKFIYLIFDIEKTLNHFEIFTKKERDRFINLVNKNSNPILKLNTKQNSNLIEIFKLEKTDSFYHSKFSLNLYKFFMEIATTINGSINISNESDYRILGILDYINKNINESLEISNLAKILDLSSSQFIFLFKKSVHLAPKEYILRLKINKSKELLENTNLQITQIAHRLSFSSSQYFSYVFKKYTMQSPKAYRKTTQSPI